jgi:TIR domain
MPLLRGAVRPRKTPSMALKVFISYASPDLGVVNFVKSMLEVAPVEVYVAEYDLPPGASITPALLVKIKECDLFIVLWSMNSCASEWVLQEIGAARSQGKTIIPVMLQQGLKPPGFISDLKFLDVPRNPEAAFAWLRENVLTRASAKQKQEGVGVLAVFGALLWLLSRK